MGASETLMATAALGMLNALLCGQPLTIMGSTGPIATYIIALRGIGELVGAKFLPLYAWSGIFLSFYMFLASMFSLSNAIRKVTRFTEELFSVLVSVIFIYQALGYFLSLFTSQDVGHGYAKAGLFVGLLTFFTALTIRGSRNGPLFTQWIRNRVADFAPVIAIFLGLGVAWALIGRYGIDKVDMAFLPFNTEGGVTATTLGVSVRPWLVDLGDIDGAGIGLAVVGGLFGFIVMYFDQNITVRLVNAREHKLKKGYGYDMDMMALCICTFLLSLFGCPWMVSATVPSLNHCRSLCFFGNEGVMDDGGEDEENQRKAEDEAKRLCVATSAFPLASGMVAVVIVRGVLVFLSADGHSMCCSQRRQCTASALWLTTMQSRLCLRATTRLASTPSFATCSALAASARFSRLCTKRLPRRLTLT
uniref:Bicarbonate transporter-like transmembrane domain-containing protein n=1 Tax=Hemiselmis andersenii TaxID=464988 RepID=A0A7S1DJH3_HEMAN|mmetsp:Transcript_15254/g.36973  ORF Transcript_15254/g.36973 Transcript_15254/m.36973 type:complete len:419 (+) Transcript_15254:476-1732(+)